MTVLEQFLPFLGEVFWLHLKKKKVENRFPCFPRFPAKLQFSEYPKKSRGLFFGYWEFAEKELKLYKIVLKIFDSHKIVHLKMLEKVVLLF